MVCLYVPRVVVWVITDVVLTFKSHVLIIPQALQATLEVKQSLGVSFLGPVPDEDGNYMFGSLLLPRVGASILHTYLPFR